jgi:hypothetical protein
MEVTRQLGDNLGIWGKSGDIEDSSHGHTRDLAPY